MPMEITTVAAGNNYGNPFIGPIDHTDQITVDVSGLTTDEVDAYGYLKPGVPLARTGILVGASPAYVYGVVIEAVKIVPINPTNGTLAAVTVDPIVAVAVVGVVNRDIAEDNLGRAYSANEIAGFDAAGSKIVLTNT